MSGFGESNVQSKDFKYSDPDFIVRISGEKDLFKPAKPITVQSTTQSIPSEQIQIQHPTDGTELKQVLEAYMLQQARLTTPATH